MPPARALTARISQTSLLRRLLSDDVRTLSRPTSSRLFSTTTNLTLRTTELTPNLLTSLRANPSRLWSTIHSTAQFGTGNRYGDLPEQTGLNRLAITPTDKQVRDWFVDTTGSLNCKVHVDEIGNIFAIRPGLNNDVPVTFAGSHLDSQPQGGRFDGVLGVCAGVEMLKVLDENWIETEGPVGVVNWTNEEGARWKRSMMGSAVWADGGSEELGRVWGLQDQGKTVREELEAIGYKGDLKASARGGVRMAGHFEVHIEQGRRLERANEKVAVVSGVQAYRWFTVKVKGTEAHAGATGWEDRADAVLWASKAVVEVQKMVRKMGGLATVGCFEVKPGSVNTVPGEVTMTLDVRHESDEGLGIIVSALKRYWSELQKRTKEDGGHGCAIEVKQDFASEAVEFNKVAMTCVGQSAKSVVGKEAPLLVSGAGHDSVNTSKHCPTAMIFVPCRDGVTHNIKEWCSEEDCAIGASVLLQSVLIFDQWRHAEGQFA